MGPRFKADCRGLEVQEGERGTSQDPRPGSRPGVAGCGKIPREGRVLIRRRRNSGSPKDRGSQELGVSVNYAPWRSQQEPRFPGRGVDAHRERPRGLTAGGGVRGPTEGGVRTPGARQSEVDAEGWVKVHGGVATGGRVGGRGAALSCALSPALQP